MSDRSEQIARIVEGVAGLAVGDREAQLTRVCGDDLELRAEVERRLIGHTAPITKRIEPAAADAGPAAEPRLSSSSSWPAPGERFGNYRIESKIGEGAMGTVFRLRHQFFERDVALKVLRPHLSSDGTLVRRFLNEARAANAIRHPNIIEVIDTGLLPEGGAPYLLMELLEGESLRARMRRLGHMPVGAAVDIAVQTASALAAAHDQGIIHRDLKPENLFLVGKDGGEVVKVLDFGIAKLGADLSGRDIPTQPGAVVGTPRYMSPEQCRGVELVDHRSDVYALGVILYEMLCGVPPFDAAGLGALLEMHLTGEPVPPRQHAPTTSPEIERAILRAIQKRPDDRFASMRDFGAVLKAAGAGLPAEVPGLAAGPMETTAPANSALGYDSASLIPATLGDGAVTNRASRSARTRLALVALVGAGAIALFAVSLMRGNGPAAPVSDKRAADQPAGAKTVAAPPAEVATPDKKASKGPAAGAGPAVSAEPAPPSPSSKMRKTRTPRPKYVPPLW